MLNYLRFIQILVLISTVKQQVCVCSDTPPTRQNSTVVCRTGVSIKSRSLYCLTKSRFQVFAEGSLGGLRGAYRRCGWTTFLPRLGRVASRRAYDGPTREPEEPQEDLELESGRSRC